MNPTSKILEAMAEQQEPEKPVSFDHELTVQQVAYIQTWSVDELLNELVADCTRWRLGNCPMDPRAVTLALERRLEDLGIARKVHVPNCNGSGGYAFTCRCSWATPS